jgi:hypothetical protein
MLVLGSIMDKIISTRFHYNTIVIITNIPGVVTKLLHRLPHHCGRLSTWTFNSAVLKTQTGLFLSKAYIRDQWFIPIKQLLAVLPNGTRLQGQWTAYVTPPENTLELQFKSASEIPCTYSTKEIFWRKLINTAKEDDENLIVLPVVQLTKGLVIIGIHTSASSTSTLSTTSLAANSLAIACSDHTLNSELHFLVAKSTVNKHVY